MPKPSKFRALTVIEAGALRSDGTRELRLEPGDEITREELHAVGQSDEDVEYLLAGRSIEPA